jgi:hypothetical protein
MITDTNCLKGIRAACGFVEDGSSQSLTIGQDDATKTWYAMIDLQSKHHAPSFTALLEQLFETYGDSLS